MVTISWRIRQFCEAQSTFLACNAGKRCHRQGILVTVVTSAGYAASILNHLRHFCITILSQSKQPEPPGGETTAHSPFVSVCSKYGFSFAVNNDLEAQGSCKLRIITAEMSYGNGPWHSWPCATLTPRSWVIYYILGPTWVIYFYKHQLRCLQCKTLTQEGNRIHPDTIDKIRRFRQIMTWYDITS